MKIIPVRKGARSLYLGWHGDARHYHSIVIGDYMVSRKANDVVIGDTLYGKPLQTATKTMIRDNPYGFECLLSLFLHDTFF